MCRCCSIQPPEPGINDVLHWPGSGLLMLGMDQPNIEASAEAALLHAGCRAHRVLHASRPCERVHPPWRALYVNCERSDMADRARCSVRLTYSVPPHALAVMQVDGGQETPCSMA